MERCLATTVQAAWMRAKVVKSSSSANELFLFCLMQCSVHSAESKAHIEFVCFLSTNYITTRTLGAKH
jgi:hypothetical protein